MWTRLLTLYSFWDVDDDGQRGEVEKEKRTISCLTEQKLQKREQRLEARRARERLRRVNSGFLSGGHSPPPPLALACPPWEFCSDSESIQVF